MFVDVSFYYVEILTIQKKSEAKYVKNFKKNKQVVTCCELKFGSFFTRKDRAEKRKNEIKHFFFFLSIQYTYIMFTLKKKNLVEILFISINDDYIS